MAACTGESESPRRGVTLDDIDASLEPVAPFELEDEAAAAAEAEAAEAGAAQLQRRDSMELLPSASPADQPRAVAEGAAGVPPAKPVPPAFDPWANDRAPMRWRDIAAACVLVPPRVAACVGLAAAALPISIGLLFLASLLPARLRQAPRVRALVVAPIRLLCRLALLGAGFWWVTTSGSFQPRRGANIIVANHSCVADVLFSIWHMAPAFLAKAEATRIPYIGAAARALGCVLVDRSSAASRAAARTAITERAEARSDGGAPPPPLLIFPEGTTSNGLCVIAWERGAFAPGRPVVPMAIAYPKGQPKPDALFSLETLRAIARPRNRMHVTFLPPYVPDVAEVADAAAFASGVRAAVAAALDVPCSELTYREGLHRKRRENPARMPRSDASAAALRNALSPLPFRPGGAGTRRRVAAHAG